MKFKTEHFEQARRVARRWRQDGYNHLLVVRDGSRAKRCYPCRQQDVPAHPAASRDYHQIPTLDRLDARVPAGESASKAELWIAATILYGCRYADAATN